MDAYKLIDKYYSDNDDLRVLLTQHSESVARKCMECLGKHPEILINRDFVVEAALLHDIGIFKTSAPDIYCYGELPYICHGVAGRTILEAEGLPAHALVCERHTGAGLSLTDIISQNLPLPHRDMIPLTIEEKLVCYADKFFSKSATPLKEKSLEKVRMQMSRHGADTLQRFEELHAIFG